MPNQILTNYNQKEQELKSEMDAEQVKTMEGKNPNPEP
jgi:hypothetical protein